MAKKDEDVELWMDKSLHIPTRTLYMGSEHVTADLESESGVDCSMAERVIKGIHLLDNKSDSEITILMNNIGGDEYHGLAIFDAIKEAHSPVIIKVYGHAMSMGAVILQAATKRIMAPNSRLMLHYGTWGVHDNSKTSYKWTEEGKRFDAWMEELFLNKILEKHPKFKLAQIKKYLDHDSFFTAQQTVDLGLADEVL